jgi:putative transposase
MKMKLTLKAKLEVNGAQHHVLDRMAFACTKLWNTANYERRQTWEETGKIPSYAQQCKQLKDNPWARLLQSQSAQAVLQKLDFAYRSWYKLRKTDKTAKPPGFRRKESLSTVTFKRSAFRIEGSTLQLSLTPKLREETGFTERFLYAKFEAHRPVEGDPCLVEVVRNGGGWYAHIVENVREPRLMLDRKAMAIDLGVVNLAACVDEGGHAQIYSGRQLLSVQRYFNKQIAHVQSRVNLQGKRWSKKLAGLARKRSRQAKHVLHSASRSIVEDCRVQGVTTIVLGRLNGLRKTNGGGGRNWGRNNQKLHAWSYEQFASQLVYKARLGGIRVVKRSERGTSRRCSRCGVVRKANRVHRGLYRCNRCGAVLNADLNGAANLLQRYLRKRRRVGVVGALARPSVSRWDWHGFSGESPRIPGL